MISDFARAALSLFTCEKHVKTKLIKLINLLYVPVMAKTQKR